MRVLLVVATAGCGRLGFDHIAGDGAGVTATPVSCQMLAPTCGPSGTSPCCESRVVTGGRYYRSYDVGTDMAFASMAYPATVSTFGLDTYEVTVGRFRQFVNAGLGTRQNPPLAGAGSRTLNGAANQGGWDASWNTSLAVDTASLVVALTTCSGTYDTWTDGPDRNESRPISCVTWFEAMAFCAWDGGFLPTEAEWNYAASGGALARAYPWSTPATNISVPAGTASYFDGTNCVGDGMAGCALTDVVPVGSVEGDGRWGQSDLGGNVWEWVLDWYADPYPQVSCTDCANLTPGPYRVFRGGSFRDVETAMRTGYRYFDVPAARSTYIAGVRCARTP